VAAQAAGWTFVIDNELHARGARAAAAAAREAPPSRV